MLCCRCRASRGRVLHCLAYTKFMFKVWMMQRPCRQILDEVSNAAQAVIRAANEALHNARRKFCELKLSLLGGLRAGACTSYSYDA